MNYYLLIWVKQTMLSWSKEVNKTEREKHFPEHLLNRWVLLNPEHVSS